MIKDQKNAVVIRDTSWGLSAYMADQTDLENMICSCAKTSAHLEEMVGYLEDELNADVSFDSVVTGRMHPYTFAVVGDEQGVTVTGDGRSLAEARKNAAMHLEEGEELGDLIL